MIYRYYAFEFDDGRSNSCAVAITKIVLGKYHFILFEVFFAFLSLKQW